MKCFCGATAANKCGRCITTAYCSRDCQVKAWPAHKIRCEKFNDRLTRFTADAVRLIGGDNRPHLVMFGETAAEFVKGDTTHIAMVQQIRSPNTIYAWSDGTTAEIVDGVPVVKKIDLPDSADFDWWYVPFEL